MLAFSCKPRNAWRSWNLTLDPGPIYTKTNDVVLHFTRTWKET
jgi:hypothetical protein